jgi:hypothetical protein
MTKLQDEISAYLHGIADSIEFGYHPDDPMGSDRAVLARLGAFRDAAEIVRRYEEENADERKGATEPQ